MHSVNVPGCVDQPPSILDCLPQVERAVFVLQAVDGLTYLEISDRLGVGIPEITEFVAEALLILDAVRHGDELRRRVSDTRQLAEAKLRMRFRDYCEAALRRRGFKDGVEWRANEDEDMSVSRTIFESLRPVDLETFLLNRVDGFSYAQIAREMGTFQWIVRRRMVRAITAIIRGPRQFADWLVDIGRACIPPESSCPGLGRRFRCKHPTRDQPARPAPRT